MNSAKIDDLKRAFFVSSVIPAYFIIVLGLIIGIFISFVRFNHGDLIFPFFMKFLPPVFVVYFFLLSLYFIYTWNKVLFLQSLSLNESVRHFVEFPRFLGIVSLIFWLVASISTFLVLYFFEIVDRLTNVSLSILTIGLGPIVSLTVRTNMERRLASLFSDYEINLKEEPDNLIKDKLRIKTLYYISAIFFVSASILIVFSGEFISRTIKDSESVNLVESYFRGEKILGQIYWKLEDRPSFIDDHTRKAILKKVQRGENVLYDYLSPSVFIFSKRGESIEGIFVPIPQAESKALIIIIFLILISAIVQAVLILTYNTSFGRYLMEAFLSAGRKLWFGGDEFTSFSARFIEMNRKYKDLEDKYNKAKEEYGYILSQIFSEFISIRTRINSVLGSIRGVKVSISRIIQMSGKESEDTDVLLDDSFSIPLEHLEPLAKKLKDVSVVINELRVEVQSLLKQVELGLHASYIPVEEKLIGSTFSVAEASIIKRMEMVSSTMRELDVSISNTSDALKSIHQNISKFRELIKFIDGILLDADRLKKKLFVLSMNISIVSGKVIQEEIMEELSAVAKQMSSLLSDDLRKVEVGLKNLGLHVRNYVSGLSSSETVDIGENYVVSAKGIAGRIDDMFDYMQNEIKQIIEQSNDMRKNLKDMSDLVRNLTLVVGKVRDSLNKLDGLAISSQQDIEKTLSSISELTERISSVASSVEKFRRETKSAIERYKNVLSEFGLLMKNLRNEIVKIQESYDKVESVLSKIASDVENITEKLQESMNRLS